MQILPLFYYPSTVAWVDDDPLFLQAAKETFKNQRIQTFDSPLKCVNFFNSYSPFLERTRFLQGKTECEEYGSINHLPVDINSQKFVQMIDHPDKNNEVSVLIIDYQMPDMSGIDLCRQLKNVAAKKILLTGQSDDSIAIAAFNEGIINCYIKKDSPTLMEDLTQQIKIFSYEYFFERSKGLLNHLEIENKIPLSDPDFCTFFKNWCAKEKINEHYIFDKLGNLQLVDEKKNSYYFVIHTEKTLNSFVELYQDNHELGFLIESVQSRKRVPFFGIGSEPWQHPNEEWDKHFYAPQILEGREKYYWFTKAKENS